MAKIKIGLIGFIVAGFVILLWGVYAKDTFLGSMLIPIGGTVVGSCLGAFVGRFAYKDLYEKVLAHFEVKFTSDMTDLRDVKQKWHMYHVTVVQDKWHWRHEELDLSRQNKPGVLESVTCHLDKDGKIANYSVEGGTRGNRLVLFEKRQGRKEEPPMYVFPFFAGADNVYFGILVHQTWDDTHSISPTLIASKLLHDDKEQWVISEDDMRKLDERWISLATSRGRFILQMFSKIWVPTDRK